MATDRVQGDGDIVVWDVTVEREEGTVETTHIVIQNYDGLIRRHIPRIAATGGCGQVPRLPVNGVRHERRTR